MKKGFCFILALVMCLSLCACGGGDSTSDTVETNKAEVITNEGDTVETNKATVITNEGDTVEMSAEELIAVYDSNEAKFDKLYSRAQITFTGTVSNIKINTMTITQEGLVGSGWNKVVFEEGWCLVIGEDNTMIDLADLDVGAVYEVTTCITGAPFDTDFLKTVSDNNRVLWLAGSDLVGSAVVETTMKAIE